MRKATRNNGFTFIEVLVAMLIFVLAGLAAVDVGRGSVRATREAKEISQATWLLQKQMVETETRLETEGIDKACDKKKEGKFEAPYQNFTWTTYCNEIDFHLSQAASQLSKADNENDSNVATENLIQKMILQTAGDYLTKSIREVHVQVNWLQGKTKRDVSVTTHFARYDQPLVIGGLGGGGGDPSSSSSSSNPSSGSGGSPK